MKVKQTVKHFTLMSMMAVGISACSSSPEVVEEVPTEEPAILEPVVEEPIKVVSAVINNGVIDIPVVEGARVFAEFSDQLPAVINYFTNDSEAQVIDFYQQAFGEPLSQERKRGRLTSQYAKGEEAMRVVISQQNRKRQVDVIIEKVK